MTAYEPTTTAFSAVGLLTLVGPVDGSGDRVT